MKLVQNKDYLFLIDEEVICKTGELYLTSIKKVVKPKLEGVIQAGDKIIAYYPLTDKLHELDLPLLPNPFEDGEMDFATVFNTLYPNWGDGDTIGYLEQREVASYIRGYRTAQFKYLFKGFYPEKVLEDDQNADSYDNWILKTIINPEGKLELVGIYT